MTIAIAATGPHAGKAILKALRTAELVCRGAIGGFVSAASINDDKVNRLQCQQGGVAGLPVGINCDEFKKGTMAGLISSGPYRPEPISAFIVAAVGSGLVTGHRLPNAIGIDGNPINRAVLNAMARGESAEHAVKNVLDQNPHADCGLIAIDTNLQGYSANTLSVNRPDAGKSYGERNNARVWVLHNAVEPATSIAALLVEITLDEMRPSIVQTGQISINDNCVINFFQPEIAINIDENHQAVSVSATEKPAKANETIAINLGFRPPVYHNGLKLGCLMYEPFILSNGGMFLSADGQSIMNIPIGLTSKTK